MPEESEKPVEPPPRSERDLLAERRARRAIDWDPAQPGSPTHPANPAAGSGQANPGQSDPTDALTRRAEAAEATVRTLETHLSSLREQVREAAEERAVFAERLAAERALVAEREHELRDVKQREYADRSKIVQQLRVEAENRHARAEHDSRAELKRLTHRLRASEHRARELSQRLESVQRELDEAEQGAIAELGELRAAGERELRARFAVLERHALEIRGEIDAERAARVQAERRLAQMRDGYRRMQLLVAELKGAMGELRVAASREPSGAGQSTRQTVAPAEHREELADALAAAVERLRARAEAAAAGEPGEPLEPGRSPTAPVERRSSHKHSMSLLGRVRLRRKQRRERRSAAAAPPNIQSQ